MIKMEKAIFILVFSLIFVCISAAFYWLVAVKRKSPILGLIYFPLIYIIGNNMVKTNDYLRDKKIFLGMGHADFYIVMLVFLWYIIGVILFFISLYRRAH